jgi:hypothetical protein
MQAAGSAEGMVVEVRRESSRGDEQLVIGRPREHDQPEEDPLVEIPWSTYTANVYQSEVFDADEATQLFHEYFRSGSTPSRYRLRKLDLA